MWEKLERNGLLTYEVLKTAVHSSGLDRVNRMAAAVAYRLMFALTPLLLIAVFTLGLFVGNSEDAELQLIEFIEDVAGPTVADAMETLAGSVVAGSNTAGVIGFALLLWAGSSLFLELQNDLNDIFGVPYEYTAGITQTVVKRLIGFGWTLSVGLVVLAIWLLNSTWRFLDNVLPSGLELLQRILSVLTPLVSLIVLPFVFALVLQTLTRVRLRWRAVWWGSFFTSLAFVLTAYGVGVYFSISSQSAVTLAS